MSGADNLTLHLWVLLPKSRWLPLGSSQEPVWSREAPLSIVPSTYKEKDHPEKSQTRQDSRGVNFLYKGGCYPGLLYIPLPLRNSSWWQTTIWQMPYPKHPSLTPQKRRTKPSTPTSATAPQYPLILTRNPHTDCEKKSNRINWVRKDNSGALLRLCRAETGKLI